MKFGLIFLLIGLITFLSFSNFRLRKELLNAREHTELLGEKNNKLHKELRRLNMVYSENERFLNELEQSIKDLESKMPLSALKQYIPKPMLRDIKPIIDRLKVLQEARESGIPFGEEEYRD